MQPYLSGSFANPSGIHGTARLAKTALEGARESVASALGAQPGEVIFTGGGTEADNLAVEGAARAARGLDGVVISAFEHKGVLAAGDRLAAEGFRVERVGAHGDGLVDLEALEAALDERTAVVSVMLVNNEVGTVQPVAAVAALVRRHAPQAVVHTDAVQAVPWIDAGAEAADAQLVAISAHKFGGPKGVGALVVRDGTRVQPLLEGGGQEQAGSRRHRERRRHGHDGGGAVDDRRASSRRRPEGCGPPRSPAQRADGRRAGHVRERGPGAEGGGKLPRRVSGCRSRGAARRAGPRRDLRRRRLLVLVWGHRAVTCPRGDGRPPRRGALRAIRLSLGFASTDEDIDRALAAIPAAVERLRAPTHRRPMNVLVLMSGGVNSWVAAARLVEDGHDVTGATLRLWGGDTGSGCCSVADVEDARRVAAQLGVPHYVFNFANSFTTNVVEPYVASYATARRRTRVSSATAPSSSGRALDRALALGFDTGRDGPPRSRRPGRRRRLSPPPWC